MICHFIRPWWLAGIVLLIPIAIKICYRKQADDIWCTLGDIHLLSPLICTKNGNHRHIGLLLILLSNLFMLLSLAGPSWTKLPIQAFQKTQAAIVALDLSHAMLIKDLSPDRLVQAKAKIHELLDYQDIGLLGLVVFTSEPFLVSPLTNDGKTIDLLLSTLTPSIMPVSGYRLDNTLTYAKKLITQTGLNHGQILVLTSTIPDKAAIDTAHQMSKKGFHTSIMPIIARPTDYGLFKPFADAGHGMVLSLTDINSLKQWLTSATNEYQSAINVQENMPTWQDQGRWFLLPALVCLWPVFRRHWLQRIRL